jgi:hypothetical protein
MITLNTAEIERFAVDLLRFNERAFPFATKQTVNDAAFETQREYRSAMQRQLVLRNKWTEGSARVEKAKTLNVSRQEAEVGSVMQYMFDQEFGATKFGKSGNVSIPTSSASGEGRVATPRRKVVRAANRMNRIELKTRTARGRNLIAVKEAAKKGHKFVYLDLGRRKGIFRVFGGRKKPRIEMFHDLSRKSVTIAPNPMLGPSVEKTQVFIPSMYRNALLFQLRRANVFGY